MTRHTFSNNNASKPIPEPTHALWRVPDQERLDLARFLARTALNVVGTTRRRSAEVAVAARL